MSFQTVTEIVFKVIRHVIPHVHSQSPSLVGHVCYFVHTLTSPSLIVTLCTPLLRDVQMTVIVAAP